MTVPYQEAAREKTEAFTTLRREQSEDAQQRRAEQMARDLPGYAEMRRQFKVDQVMLGYINLVPYSLHTVLSATTPRVVDAAWWFDPVPEEENGAKPRYDWTQFLRTHAAVEEVVARHRWVQQWRNAGPGRHVEAQIVGTTPLTEDEPAQYVYPAWKHAGFRGLPRYEVLLRRDRAGWINVYFGDQERRALVLAADPQKKDAQGQPRFWLDRLKLFYHPTEVIPEYVTVTPEGVWKRNTRRK